MHDSWWAVVFRDLYSFWVYVLSKPGKYGIKSCICYAFFFFKIYLFQRERERENTCGGVGRGRRNSSRLCSEHRLYPTTRPQAKQKLSQMFNQLCQRGIPIFAMFKCSLGYLTLAFSILLFLTSVKLYVNRPKFFLDGPLGPNGKCWWPFSLSMTQIKRKHEEQEGKCPSQVLSQKGSSAKQTGVSLGDLVNRCLKVSWGGGCIFKLSKSLCSNSTFTKTQSSRNVASYVGLPPKKENKPFWTALRLYPLTEY